MLLNVSRLDLKRHFLFRPTWASTSLPLMPQPAIKHTIRYKRVHLRDNTCFEYRDNRKVIENRPYCKYESEDIYKSRKDQVMPQQSCTVGIPRYLHRNLHSCTTLTNIHLTACTSALKWFYLKPQNNPRQTSNNLVNLRTLDPRMNFKPQSIGLTCRSR